MAPKKKPTKKGGDDWEAELGETPETISADQAPADQNANGDEAQDGEQSGMGGGLLAALKKNKTRKAKKGKPVQEEEDFAEGEDLTAEEAVATFDIAAKAPVEADAEDVFAAELPVKGKGRGAPTAARAGGKAGGKKVDADEEDGDDADGGGMKSKKEKEREKKEREKQRKKEQVSLAC